MLNFVPVFWIAGEDLGLIFPIFAGATASAAGAVGCGGVADGDRSLPGDQGVCAGG